MFNFKPRFSKKNVAKKCLPLVLSLMMVFGIISVPNLSAMAAGSFESGLGTSANPWIISTPAQLDLLRDYLGSINNDKYFQLGCDIDLTDYLKSGSAGWNPIGNYDNPFCGQLNGAGYTVSGLWINRTSTDDVGLFGTVVADGKLQNLNLVINTAKDGVRGQDSVGGLVGTSSGTISGCSVTQSGIFTAVSGSNYVGGLVGTQGDYSSITNSYATVNVYGSSRVGGLVGDQSISNITNCFATGNVSANGYMVGGLVGEMRGNMLGDKSSITNCYATGKVYGGEDSVGGLVGYQYRSIITTCYATGSVSGFACIGGLVGMQDISSITNCFFNKQTTGRTIAMGGDDSGVSSVNGLATAQMIDSTVLTGVMASFGTSFTKRTSDTDYYYYPELTAFANNGTAAQQAASKISACVIRVLPTITDITAPSVTTGQALTLTVPAITSPLETITSQGWQLSANGTDSWSVYTGTSLNISYNNYYLRYYATSDVDTVYSSKVQITVNKLDTTIGANPTASNVWQGSALSTSTLTGGTVNGIPGSFTWTNPNTVVGATGSFSVTFTPNDSNYNTASVNIAVTAIDKSALTSLISSATMLKSGAVVGDDNGKYLQQAVDTFENAITAAETMANGIAPANQSTVNDAVSTLQTAIDTFNVQVIKKPSDNPKTGDNTNLPALMAIIFISLGALIMTTRKRKSRNFAK